MKENQSKDSQSEWFMPDCTLTYYYNLAKANGFTSIGAAITYAVEAKNILDKLEMPNKTSPETLVRCNSCDATGELESGLCMDCSKLQESKWTNGFIGYPGKF